MTKFYAISNYKGGALEIIGSIETKDKETALEQYEDYTDDYIMQSKNELIEFYNQIKNELEKGETKKIKFLMDCPKFIGMDMLEYGQYESDQIADLNIDVANALIRKGVAKEVI